ncbi:MULTISPECIES: hypothetical protein [unclassified Streptomyces]|uniref:hypothetical protein n=1 Tax=unclassified Streptomyces TaxID=2593676 RepID=UPI0037F5EA4B
MSAGQSLDPGNRLVGLLLAGLWKQALSAGFSAWRRDPDDTDDGGVDAVLRIVAGGRRQIPAGDGVDERGAVQPRVASVPMLLRGAYALHSLPEVPDAELTESVGEISCPWCAGMRTTGKRTARPGPRTGSE